jgi:glycosyltransferase involved in cell wall biosynthesis
MRPKLSIVIPIHDMQGGADFLWKSINMITQQTFQDFELIITKNGKMAENTNEGIRRARGELIKILFLDDQLAHKNALKDIVDIVEIFKGQWLITGSDNNPYPYWTDDIHTGNNKLGSPSALTIRNDNPLLFDENMSWLLDCDYYKRMFNKFGLPVILEGVGVNLGVGKHQMTNILTDEQKLLEYSYMKQKYE